MTAMTFLFKLLPESLIAAWWNRQWPRARVFWDLGNGKQQEVVDCLRFDTADIEAAHEVLKNIGPLPQSGDDAKVKFIMSRFCKLFRPEVLTIFGGGYITDSESHSKPEFWSKPELTVASRRGDCDDWGILLYAVLMVAGIPRYRVKCEVVGTVRNGKETGLHFNLLYLARSDYEWYVLEGTWYPSTAIARFLRKPMKECTDLYGRILFTFNEDTAWAQHDFLVKPVFVDPKEVRQ